MHTTTTSCSEPAHDAVAVHRTRRSSAPRPGDTSSPGAPSTRSRRGRRIGAVAGAMVALALLSGCNVPVSQWVPDFNGDGQIDAAEVAHQTQAVAQAVEAHRRSVQNHPFLACVRAHESGGNYTAQNPSSSASGAYQFLTSTWRNVSARAGHPGYPRASAAPWWVQDAVALWLYSNGGRSAWAGTGC